MAFETGLEGKPWYYSAAIAVGLIALIVFGVDWFWLKDMRAELATKDQTLIGLQQKIAEGRAAEASLPQFKQEVRRLKLELDKLLHILPNRRNTEDLLRRVRALTEQGDFDLLRFTPQTARVVDFYSEWPIKIELQGTYHNLALFFDRISRFSRIINVESLNLTRLPEQSHHTLKATFDVKTFLYNDAESEGALP